MGVPAPGEGAKSKGGQTDRKDQCKIYHQELLKVEKKNWELFHTERQWERRTLRKGVSGWALTCFFEYVLRRIFWEMATGTKYKAGCQLAENGCLTSQCEYHRNAPKIDIPEPVTVHLFHWIKLLGFDPGNLLGQKGVGFKLGLNDSTQADPDQNEIVQSLRTLPGNYCMSDDCAARIYRFAVEHNFPPPMRVEVKAMRMAYQPNQQKGTRTQTECLEWQWER
jgi:hypothetical protein